MTDAWTHEEKSVLLLGAGQTQQAMRRESRASRRNSTEMMRRICLDTWSPCKVADALGKGVRPSKACTWRHAWRVAVLFMELSLHAVPAGRAIIIGAGGEVK
jgi:hypothetical protein